MTLHEIDSERFEYLLDASFPKSQLREFFTTQRQKLIVARERVQNVPADPVATICRFSAQAHAVMRAWLSTQPHENPVADEQLVPRFRSVEELDVRFSNEERIHLARSALRALYRESPPTALIDFLRTPIRRDNESPSTPQLPSSTVAEGDWRALLEASVGAAPGGPVVDAHIQVAVSLLLALKNRDLNALPVDWATPKAALEAFISNTVQTSETSPIAPRGIVRKPLTIHSFDHHFDYSSALVVATRTRSTFQQNVPWFAEAEAFIFRGEIFGLEREDLRRALPTQGEVVIHRTRGIPEPPLNEPRAYDFELTDTTHASRALANSFEDCLQPVVPMPCASADALAIRDFIFGYAKHASHDTAVFVTTDNYCLRPRKTSLASVGLPAFDWVLECWTHLPAFDLAAGTYVLEPLPPHSSLLDCGPLATVAKKVLNQLKTCSELMVPKATITAIANHLSDDSSGLSEMTKGRLLANLRSMESASDDYHQLVDSLLAVPRIASDIANRTQQAVEQRSAQTASEKQKIENLRRQAAELEASNRKLEDEREDAVREIRLAVRKAFATAIKKEASALGEMSLIAALLPGLPSTSDAQPVEPAKAEPLPASEAAERFRLLDPVQSSIEAVLGRFGLDATRLEPTAQALTVVVRAGGFVIFEGAGAAELASQLACVIAKKKVRTVEVSVGIIDSAIQSDWLNTNDADVLLLQNANLSDVSAYASELISAITRKVTGHAKLSLPIVLLAASNGPAAVPWPADVLQLAAQVSLESLEAATSAILETPVAPSNAPPLRRLFARAVERQADVQETPNEVRRVLNRLLFADGYQA